VLVAEIGDIDRFARPEQLTCGAGQTPVHHESDAHVHRGRITKQGSRLVSWAVVGSVQILPATTVIGRFRDRVAAAVAATRAQHRCRRGRPPPARLRVLRPARHHLRALDKQLDNRVGELAC
jgi:transposase